MIFYHVKDLLAAAPADDADSRVNLHCVIVDRSKTKSSLFLNLQDETGVFQGVLERDNATPELWASAIALRAGDSVFVQGRPTDKYKSAKAVIDAVEGVGDVGPNVLRGIRPLGTGSSVTQAYVARLQNHVRGLFEGAGFTEIVPRLIASTPPPRPGLYPLKVLYDGFGAPFHITPSPMPQVLQALASTSYDRVFAVSRCFTQGYRDPVVSVESVVIAAAARKTSIEDLLVWLDESVRALFQRPDMHSPKTQDWPATSLERYSDFKGRAAAAVDEPQIQLFPAGEGNSRASQLGRLCWPRLPEARSEFSEYVLAEGYEAGQAEAPAFSVVTLNVDRLLTMLFEQTDLRRIPALAAPATAVANG